MEKQNLLFQTCINVLENMEDSDFRQINSGSGLLELSCTLVEESYNRIDKISKSVEKKETAVLLMTPLLQKIKEKQLITPYVENNIIDFLSRESIEDTIDDLIITWKDHTEELGNKCF